MFISFVAAFYLLARLPFYSQGSLCSRRTNSWLPVPGSSQVKQIVYGMSQVLFAAKIPFCCLDRRMAKQELNLF